MSQVTALSARNASPVTRPPALKPQPAAPPAAPPAPPAPLPEKPRPVPFSTLPLITDAHVALAEESVANVLKVRQLALRATSAEDWTDVGGKPHLNASGALKVAALFGVSLTGLRLEERREQLGAKEVVRYIARCTARFLGREVEMEGVASSDERFFSTRDGKLLPLSEVNLNAVRKKAVTNAQSRAVKAILGLGGLTWAEVRGSGLKKEALAAVRYARKGSPAAAPSLEASRRRLRLGNLLLDLAAARGKKVEDVLRRYSEFRDAKGEPAWARSVDEMSDPWVAKVLPRVEADWRGLKTPAPMPPAKGGERR